MSILKFSEVECEEHDSITAAILSRAVVTDIFIERHSVESLRENPNGDVPEEITHSFMFKMVSKRAAFHGMLMTPTLIGMVTVLSEGNPGNAVMLLHAIHRNCVELDRTTPEIFTALHLMRMLNGKFPTNAGLHAIWESQKHPENGANLLDNHDNW